ncbi:MAG: UDP-N-acetylmuramoyl-tripeptide--D-alanyl-D-alanine ligase [Bifidobacteriaceae bacterium]|jgi:UDP-N-acetylmuramoyl-tripeptide--D-alanyl-D-alanine ligase|nr:UDP-N-acetylmuramoyl-tripeptide--D-alanyl-D-alanine ligase [Bifidobacteriaceae bacterium]
MLDFTFDAAGGLLAFLVVVRVVLIVAISHVAVRYTKKLLHIFQLNGYNYGEHLRWMLRNDTKFLPNVFLLFFGTLWLILLLIFGSLSENSLVLLAVLLPLSLPLAYSPIGSTQKKPLVSTWRVKRIIATSVLLVLLSYAILFCTLGFDLLAVSISLYFLTALLPCLPLLANFINTPMEALLRRYFIEDAKRIIRNHTSLITIGITGSYGKTSMKYYVTELLKGKYRVLMTPASFNTPLGISKTIREDLRATHEVFVCEMGAKKVGEIAELCDIVQPTHGILTAIGNQHLETFLSQENITRTKFELADAVKQRGMLFANTDNYIINDNLPAQPTVTYGTHDTATVHAHDIITSTNGTDFSLTCDASSLTNAPNADVSRETFATTEYATLLLGEHNVVNLAGAIAVAKYLGVTDDEINMRLKRITPTEHRLSLSKSGDLTILDDAYNSNPAGAAAALKTLNMLGGYKILVTPGMIELGVEQDVCNAKFGEQAAEVCDYIILVGEKQTTAIRDGLLSAHYPTEQIYVATTLQDAMQHVYSLKTFAHKVVLLENDLPDNYDV